MNSRLRSFPLTILALLLALSACAPMLAVPESEYAALLTLYEQTGGPDWRSQKGWLTDAPVCEWYGVTCEGPYVVALTMNWNNIQGVLPAELSHLTQLRNHHAVTPADGHCLTHLLFPVTDQKSLACPRDHSKQEELIRYSVPE